jgi:hypothetical protein
MTWRSRAVSPGLSLIIMHFGERLSYRIPVAHMDQCLHRLFDIAFSMA